MLAEGQVSKYLSSEVKKEVRVDSLLYMNFHSKYVWR